MSLYDEIGVGYARTRREDPRLAAAIVAALGDARRVVNVGAGAGSYEPRDRSVVAVEPSAEMIAQRPTGAAPAVRAVAEALPFADGTFDVALGALTIHHWTDWRRGLREMRRVAGRQVLLTWDVDVAARFWLLDYLPAFRRSDAERAVPLHGIDEVLGGTIVQAWPVPADCRDGFLGAFWARPRAYLDPEVRRGMSLFQQLPDADAAEGLGRLADDLDDGSWHERHGHLLDQDTADLGYRIVQAG